MELSEHYTGSQVVIVGLNKLTTTVPPTLHACLPGVSPNGLLCLDRSFLPLAQEHERVHKLQSID